MECDVYRTADGQFVIFHDDTTGRLAGRDYAIEGTDYATLKGLVLRGGGGTGETSGGDGIDEIGGTGNAGGGGGGGGTGETSGGDGGDEAGTAGAAGVDGRLDGGDVIDGREGCIGGLAPREDLRIPTLGDYISICKKYGKHCVLELKSVFGKPDIERIVGIYKKFGYLSGVTFISFDLQNLLHVRELLPAQPAQYLTCEAGGAVMDILTKNKLDVDIEVNCLNQDIFDKFKANGIAVNCWTCDDAGLAEKCARMGVDYITSNILE